MGYKSPEQERDYHKKYYLAHREQQIAAAKLWQRTHKEEEKEANRHYKQRKREDVKRHMEELKAETPLDIRPESPIWETEFPTAGITEIQYRGIKELLFRGESKPEVCAISRKSATTVSLIERSASLDDYKRIRNEWSSKYRDSHRKHTKRTEESVAAFSSPVPRDPYVRLEIAKKGFETVMIDFLANELKSAQTDLIEEVKQLRSDVKRLEEENRRLQEGTFVQSLKQVLTKQEGGE